MPQSDLATPLVELIRPEVLPLDRIAPIDDLQAVLSRIFLTTYHEESSPSEESSLVEIGFSFAPEAVFQIPGLGGFSLVFGGAQDDALIVRWEGGEQNHWQLLLAGAMRIRFPREWMRPVDRQDGRWIDDGSRPFAEIDLSAGIAFDESGNVWFEGENEFSLGPVMIADTGVVVEGALALDLSENSSLPETLALGLSESWRGAIFKNLIIHLPDDLNAPIVPESLQLTNFHIGGGGISGSISGHWDPAQTRGEFFGVGIGLREIEIEFLQNSLTEFSVGAELELPFFDQPLDVALSIDLDGNWLVSLAAEDGLTTLTAPELIEIQLNGLGFGVESGVFFVTLSGNIRPLVADIEWPSFEVEELTIDSKGNVRIEGGWIDLRDQFAFTFYGFQMEVSRIGFGKEDDGSKWIGFSAAINFIDQISLGGSVEGMRISWKDGASGPTDIGVSVEGVGVNLEIPDVLKFAGQVRFTEESLPPPEENIRVNMFRGDIDLEIIPVDLRIDASLAIGKLPPHGDIALYVYVGVELPFGILLGSTNVGIYGMAGLFAMNMAPNKARDEEWVGDLREEGSGWYTRNLPPSATSSDRWGIERDALGFGVGVTLGTYADNGYLVSGKKLLALIFPGPIILIEGGANILKERSSLSDEPIFRSLVVIDGRAGMILMSIAAQYAIDEGGDLYQVNGSAEAFFDYKNFRNWHLYLGQKEPVEKRIRATILNLFDANAYFMLDHDGLALGAWVGYDRTWSFGPLQVTLSSFIEGGAALRFKPIQFHGELHLHGEVRLRVWKFGLGLMVDARLVVDAPEPFKVCGSFAVEIELPWPLPDFGASIEMCWGDGQGRPPLPLPVKEVAIGHELASQIWSLPRGGDQPLLLPNWDTNGNEEPDGFIHPDYLDAPPQFLDEAAVIDRAPVVPLDARPQITFAKTVNAPAGIIDAQATPASSGEERIGALTYRYDLRSIKLARRVANGWADVTPISGVWSAVVDENGQTEASKLSLFAKSDFSFSRNISSSYEEWLTEQYPNYPCPAQPQPQRRCYDLQRAQLGLRFPNPWTHPDNEEVGFEQIPGPSDFIVLDTSPDQVNGLSHAVYLSDLQNSEFVISLPPDVSDLELFFLALDEGRGEQLNWRTLSTSGPPTSGSFRFDNLGEAPATRNSHRPVTLKLNVAGAEEIRLSGKDLFFYGLCFVQMPSQAELQRYQERLAAMDNFRTVWTAEGHVFQPNTTYRLTIETQVTDGDRAANLIEHAYFRTEGPPGLARLATSNSQSINNRAPGDPLGDLRLYVDATLPAHGYKPFYRAYDLGVRFNQDYVELMYALAGRDLAMYLFDQNGQPIRDAEGAIVTPRNAWTDPAIEQVTLNRSASRWIHTVTSSNCGDDDPPAIPLPDQITSVFAGQTLQGGLLHETRLIPLLLHETFRDSALNPAWTVINPTNPLGGASSDWHIDTDPQTGQKFVIQTIPIYSGDTSRDSAAKPGAYLVSGDAMWTDYRLNVVMRAVGDEDALGVVFRWIDRDKFYRFAWDARRQFRRLTRHQGASVTVLAQDDTPYQRDNDYEVTVEAVGSSLNVFVDGRRVFAAEDSTHQRGMIGLYCWAHQGARFSDIRLSDLRGADQQQQQPVVSPAVFSYQFITSLYANFRHHIHSHDDRYWRQTVADDSAIRAALPASTTQSGPPSEAETQAFETLQASVFGAGPRPLPSRTETTVIGNQTGEIYAWFIETAEPVDWRRTSLAVQSANRPVELPAPAKEVKLIGAALPVAGQNSDPNSEYVDLLIRRTADLSGAKVEYFSRPGSIGADWDDAVYFGDDFRRAESAVLLAETFGPNTLDYWIQADLGASKFGGKGTWKLDGRTLLQTSDYGGSDFNDKDPSRPGTLLLNGLQDWGDYRLECELLSEDDGGIGVVFRYKDENNYYRFSINRQKQFRQLFRRKNGKNKILWQDQEAYTSNRWYHARIDCAGDRLIGYLDHRLLFDVRDAQGIKTGQIGLYSWYNQGSRLRTMRVEPLPDKYALWEFSGVDPAFRALQIIDDGNANGPSQWRIERGVLSEISGINSPAQPEWRFGTYALLGNASWTDYRVAARVSSGDDDDLGLMFRYASPGNYYRFAINRQIGYRRLMRLIDGAATLLWEDNWRYQYNQPYELQVECRGNEISLRQDGVLLTAVADNNHSQGRVALYSYAQTSAHFDDVRVESLNGGGVLYSDGFNRTALDQLDIRDMGTVDGPSQWVLEPMRIVQLSHIYRSHPTFEPGTVAVFGAEDWTDYELRTVIESGQQGGLGAVFRFVNDDTFYRFAMYNEAARAPRRELVRVTPGSARVIWQDGQRFDLNRRYEVAIRVEGSRLRGYVDGQLLFDVYDNTIPCGRAGLYSYANGAARFHQAQVFQRSRQLGPWRIVDRGNTGTPSDWSVADGQMLQRSSIRDSAATWREAGTYALAGEKNWTDVRLTVSLQSHRDGAIGAVFRYRDCRNFYRFAMERSQPRRRLERCLDGVWTTLWEDLAPYQLSAEYELVIDTAGGRLRGALNGQSLFDVADGSHASGQIGLYANNNDFAVFHGVQVSRPPALAYRLFSGTFQSANPVGVVTWRDVVIYCRLSLSGGAAAGLLFRHTATNSHYRFELNPTSMQRRLLRVTPTGQTVLWQDAQYALAPGTFHDVVIVLRGSRIECYFDSVGLFDVTDAQLPHGRVAPYGWGSAQFARVHVYPDFFHLGQTVLEETFAGSFADRWQVRDVGVIGSSAWSFQNGQIYQTGNISVLQRLPLISLAAGSLAVTGESEWTDYRFTVKMQTFNNDGEMGVVFRYLDQNNYYRFDMNRGRSYRRLVRCRGGVYTELWRDAVSYQSGRDYLITIDAFGDRLRVYVDGRLLAERYDDSHPKGRVGLHCQANTGLRVSRVRVEIGNWSLLHQFGRERLLADGSLARLLSGSPSNDPAPPGMVRRYRARQGEAEVTLPPEGVRLRLTAPDGAILSSRSQLPDTAFVDRGFRILRRADGTGFFLLFPDTAGRSLLDSPTVRARLSYRKNIVEIDQQAPIYSQSGDESDEEVTLELLLP